MAANRGTTATMTAVAAALAVTTALTGCSSSSSSGKSATGTSQQTSAAAGATTGSASTDSAADAASAKTFCEDLRNLDIMKMPEVGAPVPASSVEVFDRLAGEAPASIKDAMKAATAAVHHMSAKVDTAGLTALGTAIGPVTTWASDPAHCPVS